MEAGKSPDDLESETATSAQKVADTANAAARDTAETYIKQTGLPLGAEDVEKLVRENPIFSVVAASAIGFLVGMTLSVGRAAVLLATAKADTRS